MLASGSSRLLFALAILALLAMFVGPQPLAVAQDAPAQAPASYVPLPKTCVGGLPPGEGGVACCIFGYVFIDGEPVAGARVTVSNSRGEVDDWTGFGPDSDRPYYRLSLSDPPLLAQPGEQITLRVRYGSFEHSISHTVLNGPQQVDAVVPTGLSADFVFQRQIWRQSPKGTVLGPRDVVVDPGGTIYVLDSQNSRVHVFDADLQPLLTWGVLGDRAGDLGGNPNSLALSGRGTIYITDSSNHRVQEFTINGSFVRAWGGRGLGSGQFVGPSGIAVHASGDLFVGDGTRIQRFGPDGSFKASWGSRGNGDGQLTGTSGIAIDGERLYVADTLNNRIQQFTTGGAFVRKWGGVGTGPGQFDSPSDIAIADGLLYVSDIGNNRIQRFTPEGALVDSWGVEGGAPGELGAIRGIAFDRQGRLVVADTSNDRLQRFTRTGGFVEAWGAPTAPGESYGRFGSVGYDAAGNLYAVDSSGRRVNKFALDGSWLRAWAVPPRDPDNPASPSGLAVSADGIVYIADRALHHIRVFSPDGTLINTWGSFGTAPGLLDRPAGLALGPDGLLYVADGGNDRIQVFSTAGQYQRQVSRYGTSDGRLFYPQGVAVDASLNIYVADTNNHRIQKFSPTGDWLATWGSEGAAPGQFLFPQSIVIGPDGLLYVADSGNHRVQLLSLAGQPIRSWGRSGGGPGAFDTPNSLAFAPDGSMLVADTWNNRAQRLARPTYTRPVATIAAVSALSVAQGQPITLYGRGADSDTSPAIAELSWHLDDAATPFATLATAGAATATLATGAIAPGRHTLTLYARDGEGERSEPQRISFDVSPAVATQAPRWTFLLYLDGDARRLDQYLNRASPVGALHRLINGTPNAQVTVAALHDGPGPGGDSYYYLIRPDGSYAQTPQGELNMGDPQTLIDFARWGLAQAPADHTYLAIADHANALDGIAWDETSGADERLTPQEIRSALATITQGGARPIDVLHFDACLMGLLEPAYQVRGLARYLVSSQNLAWSIFAYDRYRALVTPQSTPRSLAVAIADSYAQRLVAESYPVTVAALDLAHVDAAAQATDALANELMRFGLAGSANRDLLRSVRADAQKLDSGANYILQNEDEYVDLDHLAELLSTRVGDSAIRSRAEAVRASLGQLVIFNRAASGSLAGVVTDPTARYDLPNARGVGIYYPPLPAVRTYETYVRGELHFVNDQRWDEFLAVGLAALPFDPSRPAPLPVEPLPLPGGDPTPTPVPPPPGDNPKPVRLYLPALRT